MQKIIFILTLIICHQALAFDFILDNYRQSGVITDARITSFLASSYLSQANTTHTEAEFCEELSSIQFCYYPGSKDSRVVVYALHGFGNNYSFWSWNSVSQTIVKYWKESNKPRPHVISLSFSSFWSYQKENGKQLDDFVIEIEKKLNLQTTSRHLYGDSMGGYNALMWHTHASTEFHYISLICPAVPFSQIPKVQAKELTPYKSMLASLSDLLFGNLSLSGKNFDLNQVVYRMKSSRTLNKVTLLSVNPDAFGFYEGNMVLSENIRSSLGEEAFYNEVQNSRHCDVDSKVLAENLQLDTITIESTTDSN